jgi:hypothetical protein
MHGSGLAVERATSPPTIRKPTVSRACMVDTGTCLLSHHWYNSIRVFLNSLFLQRFVTGSEAMHWKEDLRHYPILLLHCLIMKQV